MGCHWLRPAAGGHAPKVLVSFDTETTTHLDGDMEVLQLRCWDTLTRVRAPAGGPADVTMPDSGLTAGGLADVIEAASTVTGEAWAIAHNVGFDLAVTSLPLVLSHRGWQPAFVHLGDETTIFSLRHGKRRLVITDSWSWLHCSLGTAARDVGMRKTRLPAADDTTSRWHERCAHDVTILDRLLSTVLDWWDGQDLGGFGTTGAACGWRTLRKHVQPKAILVGSEPPRTALERDAIYGGRKEVWRVGRLTGRRLDDWDFVEAHLTTMRSMLLPAGPVRGEKITPRPDPLCPPVGLGAVCRVTVRTRVPCAPVRIDGDVWWPVGQFTTTLTTVELAEVAAVADQVEILDTQWYRLGDQLQPWAKWALGLRQAPAGEVPDVIRRIVKGWGRSVPGRFALRTSRVVSERPAGHLGWAFETGVDLETDTPIEVLTFAGTETTSWVDQDGADVFPAVLAFVEGHVRRALAETLRSRDPARLVQCNTDGWWELRQGRSAPGASGLVPAPYTAALKSTVRDLTVRGPNHTQAPGDRRLSGVPATASSADGEVWRWRDWPGLRWQLQHARPGEFRRPERAMVLADHYVRRWVLETGETIPATVTLGESGQPVLEPWARSWGRRPGDRLASGQVPALAAVRAGGGRWRPASLPELPAQPGRLTPSPS